MSAICPSVCMSANILRVRDPYGPVIITSVLRNDSDQRQATERPAFGRRRYLTEGQTRQQFLTSSELLISLAELSRKTEVLETFSPV